LPRRERTKQTTDSQKSVFFYWSVKNLTFSSEELPSLPGTPQRA
jgi:hypothetical protein